MPYIDAEDRRALDPKINDLAATIDGAAMCLPADAAGLLNYSITRLIMQTIGRQRRYWAFCLAIGTLFCVALEVYRRVVAPYEDMKKDLHGDVPEFKVQ